MGLDYIRKESSRRPWTRRWDMGLDRLKTPTLFDLKIGETLRLFTVQVMPGEEIRTDKTYLAQRDGNELILCDGFRQVARSTKPTADALAKIDAGCGYAVAQVQRVGLFKDSAEIGLK